MSRVSSRGADSGSSSVEPAAATLLRDAAERIGASRNIEHWQPGLALWDAQVMLAHVVGGLPDDDLDNRHVSKGQQRTFEKMVRRRLTGEPVNYITGRFEFHGLELKVRRGVFSPRSSSEFIVDEAVSRLRRRRRRRVAVDVATGSGAIALAVAAATRDCEVRGLDISADAVRLGRDNAKRLRLDNVQFVVSDMLSALPESLRGEVGMFTIHPPYVARAEVKTLPVEVRRFEPHSTLTDGSDDGLGLVRILGDEAPGWLAGGGWVLVEVAPYLARATATILRRAGLRDVRSQRDRLGVTRVVGGRV